MNVHIRGCEKWRANSKFTTCCGNCQKRLNQKLWKHRMKRWMSNWFGEWAIRKCNERRASSQRRNEDAKKKSRKKSEEFERNRTNELKKIMKEIHKWMHNIIRTMQVEKLKMETTENLKSFGNIFKIQCTYIHFWYALIRSVLVPGSYCLLILWLLYREQMRARKKKQIIYENE